MSHIFIAAHARSGSTYLCQLLNCFSKLKVYYEIFHSDINIIKSHLHGDYPLVNQAMQPDGAETTRKEIVASSEQYLSLLSEKNQGENFVFKVFPGHLPLAALQNTVSSSEVIVILYRNLLHSYISDCIATNEQRWTRIDTSDKKVHFSEKGFLKHVERIVNYYTAVKETAENKKIVEISYEKLISSDTPILDVQKIFNKVNYKFNIEENTKITIKLQDKRVLAEDKVSNPEALIRFLELNNLEALNDGKSNISQDIYIYLIKPNKSV